MTKLSPERAGARQTLSALLFTIAGIVLTTTLGGVYFVVDKRLPGVTFWVLFGVCVVLVVYSFYTGARGIEKINEEHSFFNRQAIALLASFVSLLLSFPFLGPEKTDQTSRDLGQVHQELGALKAEIGQLKVDFAESRKGQAALDERARQLRLDVDSLKQPASSNPNKAKKSQPNAK